MASPPSNEKGLTTSPPPGTVTQTSTIHEKDSTESLNHTQHLSPRAVVINEPVRNGRNGRSSDVSTPTSVSANPFDTDVEAQTSMHPTETHQRSFLARSSTNLARGESGAGLNQDCQVWPGQSHWKNKHKAAKRKNASCNCLSGLSQRNRIIAKILIAMLVVATAVGVGFGISKPLGAPIWKPNNQ